MGVRLRPVLRSSYLLGSLRFWSSAAGLNPAALTPAPVNRPRYLYGPEWIQLTATLVGSSVSSGAAAGQVGASAAVPGEYLFSLPSQL